MTKFYYTKLFIIFLLLGFLNVGYVFAAEITLDTDKNVFSQNEEFVLKILLNTENEYLNAIDGTLMFPSDKLEFREIRDGNSAINFWMEKPQLNSGTKIIFSGITTGGIIGNNKHIFSVIFKTKKEGNGTIEFEQLRILKNDGSGTNAKIEALPFNFSVSKNISSESIDRDIIDTDKPEDFLPIVGIDESILDGKYFLTFSTQDKGVGIDYYKVKEGYFDEYTFANSPYVLKNQSLKKDIYVMAVDKNNNQRVVKIQAQNYKWYQDYLILSIILIIVFGIFIYKKNGKI